jgi:hypothetical protein
LDFILYEFADDCHLPPEYNRPFFPNFGCHSLLAIQGIRHFIDFLDASALRGIDGHIDYAALSGVWLGKR